MSHFKKCRDEYCGVSGHKQGRTAGIAGPAEAKQRRADQGMLIHIAENPGRVFFDRTARRFASWSPDSRTSTTASRRPQRPQRRPLARPCSVRASQMCQRSPRSGMRTAALASSVAHPDLTVFAPMFDAPTTRCRTLCDLFSPASDLLLLLWGRNGLWPQRSCMKRRKFTDKLIEIFTACCDFVTDTSCFIAVADA